MEYNKIVTPDTLLRIHADVETPAPNCVTPEVDNDREASGTPRLIARCSSLAINATIPPNPKFSCYEKKARNLPRDGSLCSYFKI